MRNYAGTCKVICSYNLVYNFLVLLFGITKFSFCCALFKRILAYERVFPKGSSQNDIVPLLVIFHLPYNKYTGVKICFHLCRYQNNFFCSCPTCVVGFNTRLVLALHLCCSCSSRVALVWLVSGSRVVNQTKQKKSVKNNNIV